MSFSDSSLAHLCDVAQDRAAAVIHEIKRVDASNQKIVDHAEDAASVAATGFELAEETNTTCAELGVCTEEIGEVIRLIDNVAGDTHLLALNATIEAARAGEAGKGFAVVAAEVKQLATQTASATQQVTKRISAIQSSARKSIDAVGSIVEVITRIGELQTSIASEIKAQDGMTLAIHNQVAEVTENIHQITEQIGAISEGSQG